MEGHTLLAGLAELGRGARSAGAQAGLGSYGGESLGSSQASCSEIVEMSFFFFSSSHMERLK